MKKAIIFFSILFVSILVGYRVQQIRLEGDRDVHNIVRIQAENGVPREYIIASKSTDALAEPLYVQNGRALVSVGRINKFKEGLKVKGNGAKIDFVSRNIDLDSGMFVVKFSKKITGNVFVEIPYTGFFLPLDAKIPDYARIIAKDSERQVVSGLADGDRVIVR